MKLFFPLFFYYTFDMTIIVKYEFRFIGDIFEYSTFQEIETLKYYHDISYINCSKNALESLPSVLPYNLKKLECDHNHLTYLPELPEYLEVLNCKNNNLTKLPHLPDNLGWLYTSHNHLVELPELPIELRILVCNHNNLTILPYLPINLISNHCHHNKLECLPNLPDNLHYFYYDNNPIYNFIETYFDGRTYFYKEWISECKKKYANTLGNWFLECKYNPKYKYCRDTVNARYDELIY